MDINRIDPFVREAVRGKIENKTKDASVCYDSSLYYITSGQGDAYIGESVYSLSAGALVYIPASKSFAITTHDEAKSVSYVKVSFDFTHIGSHREAPIAPCRPAQFDKAKLTEHASVSSFTDAIVILHIDEISSKFNEILNEFDARAKLYGAEGRLSAMLKELLIIVARATMFRADHKNNLAHDVISYINSHLDEPLNNSSIASAFGYHPYYLTRVLREEIGMTPHKYLMTKRCEYAKNLLLVSDHTIETIAQMSGFTSQSHFAATFRQLTGITPTDFRRKTTHK